MDEDDVSFTLSREKVDQAGSLEEIVEETAQEMGYYVLEVDWASHTYAPHADEFLPKRKIKDRGEEFPLFDTSADVEWYLEKAYWRLPGGTVFVAHVADSPNSNDFYYYCYGYLNRIE